MIVRHPGIFHTGEQEYTLFSAVTVPAPEGPFLHGKQKLERPYPAYMIGGVFRFFVIKGYFTVRLHCTGDGIPQPFFNCKFRILKKKYAVIRPAEIRLIRFTERITYRIRHRIQNCFCIFIHTRIVQSLNHVFSKFRSEQFSFVRE